MKYVSTIMIAGFIALLPLSASGLDLGKIVNSTVGGIEQAAKASKTITPAEEHYIGRAVAAQILQQYPLLGNGTLDDYLNKVGLVVAYRSDRPETYGGYHFAVLKSDTVNAFACPGGIIFVTTGLLRTIQNEDQLASILGHEVAHVAKRHGISAIKKSRWTKFGFYAAGEVGKQYSASEVGQLVGEFQGVVSDVAKQVIQNGYSKSAEKEADRLGMTYAARAGYAPEALASYIQHEMKKGVGTKSGPFSSHPSHTQRMQEVKGKRVSQAGSQGIAPVRTARFEKAMASLR